MLDLGHPFNMGHGILGCKKRHPLLLECFILFLKCIRMNQWVLDSICNPLMVHTVSFWPTHRPQISWKMLDLRHHINMGSGMLPCKKRHWLLLGCFVTVLKCMRMIRGALDSMYKSLMAHKVIFLLKPTLKFHENVRFWAPYHMRHGMLCYKGSRPLLLDYFITILK